MDRAEVVELALKERQRQDELWDTQFGQHSHLKWLGLTMEELGETVKALNEHDLPHAQYELVQTIATAMSWLEYGEF